MGLDFKAPRKENVRAWSALKERGYTFNSCGCGGPGFVPNLTGVETLVRHKRKSARAAAKQQVVRDAWKH